MSFLKWLFGWEETHTERDREIDAHIEIVNIKMSIQKEAEEEFEKAYNKFFSVNLTPHFGQ